MSKPSKGDAVTVWEVVLCSVSYHGNKRPTLVSRPGQCTGKTVRFERNTSNAVFPAEGPTCGFHKSWPVEDLSFTEQDAIARWKLARERDVAEAEKALVDARSLAAAEIVRGDS